MKTTGTGPGMIVLAVLLGGVGCRRGADTNAGIQRAIEEHLSQRSDLAMDQMVMEVQQVKVEGDHAEAEVVFRTTAEPPVRMAHHYELRREGNRWQVASGRPSTGETPHPTWGESETSAPALPEGHPPLPEGHPPIDEPPPHP